MTSVEYSVSATIDSGRQSLVGVGDLGRAFADSGESYVEDGLSVTLDESSADPRVDITAGVVYLLAGEPLLKVHTGQTPGIDLIETNGVNYLYLTADPATNEVSIVVSDTLAEPSGRAVRFAAFDTSSDTVEYYNDKASASLAVQQSDVVRTEELNSARTVAGGATAEEINTALQNHDGVVLMGDHSSLTERIEPQTGGSLTVFPGAHVSFADDASPTMEDSVAAKPVTPLLFLDNVSDVDIHIHGTLDANNTNIENSRCIVGKSSNGVTVHQTGPNLKDCASGVYAGNCDEWDFPNGISAEPVNAAVGAVNSANWTGGIVDSEGGEGIDMNGDDETWDFDAVRADSSEEVVDINASKDASFGRVVGLNEGSSSIFKISEQEGDSYSCDDVTVREIRGTAAGKAITVYGDISKQNLHIKDANVVSTGLEAAEFLAQSAGQLNGLRVSGRFETQSSEPAVHLGGSGLQSGIKLDAEVISQSGVGLSISNADFHNIRGSVSAHDCGGDGMFFNPGSNAEFDLTVDLRNNGRHGATVKANGVTLRGRAVGNANHSVNVSPDAEDTDLRLSEWGTIRNEGTRTRWYGVIGGGPLGGVDIGSIDTTAIDEGALAVSDGTTNTAGKTYRWHSGSWVDA